MRAWILAPVLAIFVFSLGAYAQNGGCSSTGQSPYDYSQALCMAMLFYEAQRSGYLPADNRVDWRGDSATGDGSDVGLDLEGGYYDAGDFVKFGFPLAYSVAVLAWGLDEYSGGYRTAGQTAYGRATIKRATDYLLKCHAGSKVLYGQCGDGDIDHEYWGRPEEMTMSRPSYKIDEQNPGADLAAETAAGLAAASIVFQGTDASYANQLLDFAKEMLELADEHQTSYVNSIPAGDFYNSWSGFQDELGWGACWLYKATGEQSYYNQAEGYYNSFNMANDQEVNFYWDDKTAGVYALMTEFGQDSKYNDRFAQFLDSMRTSQRFTNAGLIFINDWGSIRHALGLAFIAIRGADLGINPATNRNFAQTQIDYAVGSQGHSFVVGFGTNPPTHAHHRAASCEDPPAPCSYDDMNKVDPNPHVIYGGLVGGPTDTNDNWQDNRSNWQMTEVGLDYNAVFSSTLAAIITLNY